MERVRGVLRALLTCLPLLRTSRLSSQPKTSGQAASAARIATVLTAEKKWTGWNLSAETVARLAEEALQQRIRKKGRKK